ncbi:MAG: prepilin-type N-terminal cleavage/methylation domain-containing protein [Acidobacteriota bacterium]
MTTRGFTLVELLVGLALSTVGIALALAALGPARAAAAAGPAGAELTQRLRVALDLLAHDVQEAGATPLVDGQHAAALAAFDDAIALGPALDGDPPPPDGRPSAVELLCVRRRAAQARLRDAMAHPTDALRLVPAPQCPAGAGVCGFVVGDLVLAYASDHAPELARVARLVPSATAIELDRALAQPLPAGAIVVAIDRVAYGRRVAPDGTGRLVRITDAGAEQPVIDHVAVLAFARRNGVLVTRLVLDTPGAAARGSLAASFHRPGHADVSRWVPDVDIELSLARRP